MSTVNTDIKEKIRGAGLYQYQVAKEVGISEAQFIRWLRDELPECKKNMIDEAIHTLEARQVI